MLLISLNENEKILVLSLFPEEAACKYYDRMVLGGRNISLSDARDKVKEYITTLDIPEPSQNYLKGAPFIGLKVWRK